jgi:hypothetical protein
MAGCGGGGDTGSGGSTASSSNSANSGSSSASGFACSPTDPACTKVTSDCIALADNKGLSKFALRMAQLDITKPAGLTKPLVKGVVSSGVAMNLDKCNLGGGGTFNLIMNFDTTAKTLQVGSAKPAMDPTLGYTFVNETVQMIPIAPITSPVTLDMATGAFMPTGPGIDIVLAIYLTAADPQPGVLLPLKKATITGTLSTDQNCVGKYNADKLDPKAGCAGTDANPAFTTAADLAGYMTLEAADGVIVSAVGQSLCVLISGDSTMWGDGKTPAKCKRDPATMKILYQGDWCDGTNMPAGAGCADASALAGKLAASAVKLN